jgi:hypothetical protein
MATDTAGGVDQLTVRLTVARGQAYGPSSDVHDRPARLSGTIRTTRTARAAKNYGRGGRRRAGRRRARSAQEIRDHN